METKTAYMGNYTKNFTDKVKFLFVRLGWNYTANGDEIKVTFPESDLSIWEMLEMVDAV